MRITEIILEDEQLDELSLKGLGTGLGKVPGAIAGGVVQGAKNIWQGAKQGYAAGQAALAPDGQPAPSASGTSTTAAPASSQAASGGVSVAPASGQAASGSAPTAAPASSQAASGSAASGSAPTAAPAPSQSASGGAPAVGPLKAAEIVKNLDDVWKKATADQGSETTSPKVQQQIRAMAKNAGLAGQTVESEISRLKSLSGI